MFDDLVRSDHFASSPLPIADAERYADRIMSLRDQRFHIAHFLFELPDRVCWSPEMYDICGVPPRDGDLSLSDVVGAFDPADRPTLAELLARSLRERQGFEATLRIRRPDGTVRLVELAGDTVAEDGRLVAIVGLVRDITGAVSRPPSGELERMVALVESMPGPAVLTDSSMRILGYSDAWARSHGVNGRTAYGADLISAVPRAPVGWAMEHDKVVAGKTIVTERTFHSAASGRPINCPTTLRPWIDGEGNVRGVLTVVGWSELVYASKEIAVAHRKQMRGAL